MAAKRNPPPKPYAPPGGALGNKPVSEMADDEVNRYVAFVLESWAHLQGFMGAIPPVVLLQLAERLRLERAATDVVSQVRDELLDPDRASVHSVNAALAILNEWLPPVETGYAKK